MFVTLKKIQSRHLLLGASPEPRALMIDPLAPFLTSGAAPSMNTGLPTSVEKRLEPCWPEHLHGFQAAAMDAKN